MKGTRNSSSGSSKITSTDRDIDSTKRYIKYPLSTPGSIVCSFFNLHNVVPSEICVSAVLSISTYGQRLHDDDKEGAAFEDDFRSKVLHSYKSLLISELAQMYIRHSVNSGKRNPITGKPVSITDNVDEKQIKKLVDLTMTRVDDLVNKSYACIEASIPTANSAHSKRKYNKHKMITK